MSSFLASLRRSAAFAGALLLFAMPASAWDIEIGLNFLYDALYVSSSTGSGATWTTVDERVRASDVPGPTIPNIWTTQAWDGMEWPSDTLSASEGITWADLYHDDVTEEFFDSGSAAVFGSVAAGDAAGAGFAYDFDLVVNPFSSATVSLDPAEAYVYLDSGVGDVGTAFARFRLYSTDYALNDPGGANAPWADDLYSIEAGDPLTEEGATFSNNFVNGTGSPVTYHLRMEASASVFAIPEPAGLALLGVAGLMLAVRRRA
ncbi:MAG: PEP-CTERM sorting domain-containing protein [bacterium]|nr:PEP-CTERM sorting domain-containing protein [bacterium]